MAGRLPHNTPTQQFNAPGVTNGTSTRNRHKPRETRKLTHDAEHLAKVPRDAVVAVKSGRAQVVVWFDPSRVKYAHDKPQPIAPPTELPASDPALKRIGENWRKPK